MVISFGFGVLTEYSLLNKDNNPTITTPTQPVPLAVRYKTSSIENVYDTMPALPSNSAPALQNSTSSTIKNSFVASKTGTKYYPIDCGSVSRIKEENRVYFTTEDEAKDKGYERTTSCK